MLYRLLKPLLFRLDAERAHDLVSGLLRATAGTPLIGILRAACAYDNPILVSECAGLRFENPVGLAAGFDKRAALIAPMAALGFGHVEVGTVTPRPQPGNERPRLFRLSEDRALINRMGFNSQGMVAVAQTLREQKQKASVSQRKSLSSSDDRRWTMDGSVIVHRLSSIVGETRYESRESCTGDERWRLPSPIAHRPSPIVVGANIGKNRTTLLERAAEDYVAAFVALAPLADYVTVNISSPNTPGLRRLHERAALDALLGELAALNRRLAQPRPLFLKVSPDEAPEQLEEVVRAGCAAGIAGFVATNTTLARDGLRGQSAGEAGGLSGRPLTERSRQTIGQIYRLTGGKLPVIGAGGVAGAADAYAHIRAGASLVQIYTGMIYEGPRLIYTIKRGLARRLREEGFRSLGEAVGNG